MKCSVCHPGTQHSAKLAEGLFDQGCLKEFWTGLRISEAVRKRFWRGLSSNRSIPGVIKDVTREVWLPELLNKCLCGLKRDRELVTRLTNGLFQRWIPERCIQDSEAVVGFDTSSWLLAQRTRAAGKEFILDRTTIHRGARSRIRAEFVGAGEALALARVGAVSDVQSELEDIEMELATRIVVASDHSRESLIQNGIEDRRIAVIPYGVDTDVFFPGGDGGGAKPVLLFVGNLTREKGVCTLLEAWRELNTSAGELWLAGPINPMVRSMADQMDGVRLLGKLDREQLVGAYQRATAFVFPTFYDGFGLVLLEAIACGLPIVATRSCAAPDLIKEGAPGMLCTAGDSMGLAAVLADVLSKPGSWNKGRSAARKTAKRYSWAEYGRRWAALIGGMSA